MGLWAFILYLYLYLERLDYGYEHFLRGCIWPAGQSLFCARIDKPLDGHLPRGVSSPEVRGGDVEDSTLDAEAWAKPGVPG